MDDGARYGRRFGREQPERLTGRGLLSLSTMSAVSPPTQERAVLAVDANRVATVSLDSSEASNGLALSGSSVIGALNAVALERLLLPRGKQSGKT